LLFCCYFVTHIKNIVIFVWFCIVTGASRLCFTLKFCIMRSLCYKIFQSGVSRSFSPRTDLNLANCSMEFFINTALSYGQIEWLVRHRHGGVDVVYIGLAFDKNLELVEFDGVYPLPCEAAALISEAGFRVPCDAAPVRRAADAINVCNRKHGYDDLPF